MKEAKKTKRVSPNINSDFPDILCVDQLLKIFRWNWINLSNQLQYPCYLCCFCICQAIQVFFNRTLTRRSTIEWDCFHNNKVNKYVNIVKAKICRLVWSERPRWAESDESGPRPRGQRNRGLDQPRTETACPGMMLKGAKESHHGCSRPCFTGGKGLMKPGRQIPKSRLRKDGGECCLKGRVELFCVSHEHIQRGMGPVGMWTVSLSFLRPTVVQGRATVPGLQETGGRWSGWIPLNHHTPLNGPHYAVPPCGRTAQDSLLKNSFTFSRLIVRLSPHDFRHPESVPSRLFTL